MRTFSQRMGLVQRGLQTNSLDKNARMTLWNFFFDQYLRAKYATNFMPDPARTTVAMLWSLFLHRPLQDAPRSYYDAREKLYPAFLEEPWNVVLDMIEYCASQDEQFRLVCNHAFEMEGLAYRLIGKEIVPLREPQQLVEIEGALARTSISPLAGAQVHLKAALEKLGQRPKADERNAIKEAISAVEVVARVLAGEGNTLGAALKRIKVDMNAALKAGLEKIYGWTNGEDGIRHALMDQPKISMAEARFMVVTCSAFVNYLLVKADEAGIQLA